MKFLSKLKNVIAGVGIGILIFANKVFAISSNIVDPGPVQLMYGIPYNSRPDSISMIAKMTKIFIIPIVVIVGLLIYFKKSESSRKKKLLVTLGIITITAILYFIINKIIDVKKW